MRRRVYAALHTAGLWLFILTILATASPVAAQTTVVLDAPDAEVLDTWIRGGSFAGDNYDDDTFLATRASSSGDYARRAILKFDTENKIPKNALIRSATLTLTVSGGNAQTRTISAYRLAEPFDTWDLTWKKRKASITWATAGGALGGKYASGSVNGSKGAKLTFDVAKLVQETVNGNFGSRYTRVALIDNGASTKESYKEFYTSNASDASVRPRLTVVYGGTATNPSTTPDPTTGTALRLVHWNLHHGVGTDGKYDIARIGAWIAKMKPDIVSLNEVEKFTSWGNEDQPRRYEEMLEKATGRSWYAVWAQEYGQWSSNGKGNLLLSRYPFSSSARYELSHERTVALGQVNVNGKNITVMTTHFDPDSGSRRLTQTKELLAWAKGFTEGRIIAGDLNAQPTSSEMVLMKGTYKDMWADALAAKVDLHAPDNPNGYTRNSRIDYVFTSKAASSLVMKSVEVVDTRDANGKMPSDHRPIVVVYTVR